jgi:hypothetical protein
MGDHSKDDFVLFNGNNWLKIQVKAANKTHSRSKHHAEFKFTMFHYGSGRTLDRIYYDGDFDVLALYPIQLDTWYLFPASEVDLKCHTIAIPCSENTKYLKYKERWDILT